MRFDYGYAEEDRLGKPYDVGLLRRLWPFMRPYGRLLALSVGLVLVITLLELALPYFSKIAIDRYIVPGEAFREVTGDASVANKDRRRLRVDPDRDGAREVITRHGDLFESDGGGMFIAYDRLHRLSRRELMIIRGGDLRGVAMVVLVFLAVVAADFALTVAQRMIMEYAGHKVMHDLRVRLYDHIQGQKMSFFDHQPVARLVTRVTNDVQNMHELFTTFIAMVFKDFFLLAGIAAVIISLDRRLALAGFAVLPVVVWAAFVFSSKARDVFRALRVKVAEINSRMAETMEGIRTIQAFGREEENYRQFADLNAGNYRLGMRQIHIFAVFMPIIEVLGLAAVSIMVFYGGQRVLHKEISLGAFVAAVTYLRMFFRPLRDLAENYNVLQNAMASAERIFALFDKKTDEPAEGSPRAAPSPPRRTLRSITLERVTFAYAPGEMVLKEVSMTIQKGRTLALVGPTGSGKTSLLGLILGLYAPVSGTIRINGQPIAPSTAKALRAMTALVPQDPVLFSGTLRAAIFGENDAADAAAVDRVIAAANCRELVNRLPQGLDTQLVKGGAALSSGERQLATIARALARDPQLILLDEATSYIDSQTEAAVHKALGNLMKGRTAVIVAHRLSTARMADAIYVLRNGRVVEFGGHETLMAQKGVYWRMVRRNGGQ